MINIGEKIRLRREELQMSMRTLSNMTGISFTTIGRYERGEVDNMPAKNIIVISEALQVPPNYLLTEYNDNCFVYKINNKDMFPLLDIGDECEFEKLVFIMQNDICLAEYNKELFVCRMKILRNGLDISFDNNKEKGMFIPNKKINDNSFEVKGRLVKSVRYFYETS